MSEGAGSDLTPPSVTLVGCIRKLAEPKQAGNKPTPTKFDPRKSSRFYQQVDKVAVNFTTAFERLV